MWSVCTVQRLCSGRWYDNIIMIAVVDRLERQQEVGRRYCHTDFMLGGWDANRQHGPQRLRTLNDGIVWNHVVNHDNVRWAMLISLRMETNIDIIYVDSLQQSAGHYIEKLKLWWTQLMRQATGSTPQLHVRHITCPRQQDNVQCGVFVLCYHQVVFRAAQDTSWRAMGREQRLLRLSQWLQEVTPEVTERKRRDIRENFHTHGSRLEAQISAQMSPLLADLSKHTEKQTQDTGGRGKRKRLPVASSTVDAGRKKWKENCTVGLISEIQVSLETESQAAVDSTPTWTIWKTYSVQATTNTASLAILQTSLSDI